MTDAVSHRGPESADHWINTSHTATLGHRRLCIIDTSDRSIQPMHYLDRYTIVHNGEIYNYIECRQILESKGYSFKTASDTEVILAAYDCYRERCLDHFDGMFAFAIWDEKEQQLFCARDRFGEKPFYYIHDESRKKFSFASEMKALRRDAETSLNNALLLVYMSVGHTSLVHDPSATLYNNIRQLEASHYLIYNPQGEKLQVSRYWKCDANATSKLSEAEAIERFNELFTLSVSRRLRSDVPVGSSLSGGLDSSSIVASVSSLHSSVAYDSCFSAVFPGQEKDESGYIKLVADQFSLNSYTVAPDAYDLANELEHFIHHQESPVISASVYAQYKVFELAKKHNVTVLLDGQGADETLAGYGRYLHWYLQQLWRERNPLYMREKLALQQNDIPFHWDVKNYIAALFPSRARKQLEKRESIKIKHNRDLNEDFIRSSFSTRLVHKPEVRSLNDILYFNTFQLGLEELLRYADRNSMAFGREVRLPFLYHELVSFIFSLPPTYKIRNGWTKWLLRASMKEKLPSEIVWRKDKIGFEPPQEKWLQTQPLVEMIYESKKNLVSAGIMKASALAKKNQPQQDAATDWRYLVSGMLLK
jgi:asparagine synthase (glutamine-hydrolysing)